LSKNSSLTIKNNRIENGYVGFAEPSGYIVSVNSEDIIESNIIINTSMGYCWVCAVISILDGSNCIIRNNLILQASGDGYGAVVASESQYVSHNNTFVSNSVGYANLSSDGIVSNDIIFGSSNTVYIDETSTIQVSYSDIQGGWEGTGNIDTDPLFVAPDSGDFHLQENSPCIDTGDPNSSYDPDGTIADMGAYYYHQESGVPTEIIIDYQSDWNLVGLPLEVEVPYYLTIFPDATENTFYSFDETYVLDSTLVQGAGYWLRFDTTGTTTITGNPIDELTISLSEGWNMVSGLHEDLSIYSINDPDSTIVPNTMYGFSETYFLTETLVPGKGYWLRAYQDGEVTITGDGLARITPQDYSLNDRANTLTINGMDLYFCVEMSGRERLSFSLPPKPPAGAFDIRFKGDTRVTMDKAKIEVMSTTETLTIAYDIKIDAGEHMNWVLTSESGTNYILEGSGEVTIPSSETFILNRESVIPVTFVLHQNYPNPFNPITTLRYDLPSDALVTLSIYDMLGREITQLVNTTQQAGFKSVQWDATDSMGRPVSAGAYLYQIQAGEFVQTKKMVLLK
jgi:hypothetical protein